MEEEEQWSGGGGSYIMVGQINQYCSNKDRKWTVIITPPAWRGSGPFTILIHNNKSRFEFEYQHYS